MVTSGRLLVCVVGAMCASAPPAGGFAPPGYLSNMQPRSPGKSCISRRPRYAPRVSGAGDAFYFSERRLHEGGRKAGYGERHGKLRGAGCRRRRSNAAARMMSTVAPSASKMERPPPCAPVPQEIRPEEELRLKMQEAGIKRPKGTSVPTSSTKSQSRPRSRSPQVSVESTTVRASQRRGSRSSADIKIKYAPEHAGRHPNEISSTSLGRGGGGTSLQFYLRNMAKTQLLKAEEEKILGRQIQKGMQYLKVREHLTAVRGVPPTKEEWSYAAGVDVEELVSQLNRAERAKIAMINANLRLVVSITKRYRLLGMAFTDLIQEGTFGLMRAAEKFDPERGFRFSTYAVWWIRQAAMRSVMDQSRVVRLPVHVHQLLLQVKKATKELQEIGGAAPKDEAVGSLLGTSEHRIQFYRKAAQAIVSMQTKMIGGHKPQESNKEAEMGDIVKAVGLSPETDVSTLVLRDRVVRLLSTLNDREREVMRARFGIDGDRRKTLEGIGQRYGLSRERIRQIEVDALFKLRQPYHAYRELKISAEQLMIYGETRAPDAAAVEAASAEVAEAEAAAKVAQLNYMRARLGMPRAKPEAQVPASNSGSTSTPEGEESGLESDASEELTDRVADRVASIFGSDDMDPSVSGESPEDWARRVLSEGPLLGTEADKRAYGERGSQWRSGEKEGQESAGANSFATVEIPAKSLMTLTGDERETWSSMIEHTEPWSGPVQGHSSERASLDVAAEQWSFGVESAKLSGDMTPEQWERALTAME